MKKYLIFIILCVLLFSTSCSIRKIVVTQLKPVIIEVEKGILSEQEEKIAADSLPFSIKFTEGLYSYYPTKFYSAKLSLLYGAYAFAYVDEGPYDDFDNSAEMKKNRASVLYKKAFLYGKESLDARAKGFSSALESQKGMDEILSKFKKKDVEALFWFNFSWAMLLFNDMSDVSVLVNLDIIRKISERIIELDEGYYYGGAWAILSAYYGGRTSAIGGNYEKALASYNKSITFSKNKSLIPDFVMMRFVATQLPNSVEFKKYFEKIQNFEISDNPEIAFLNTMLKRKAIELNKKIKLLFVD